MNNLMLYSLDYGKLKNKSSNIFESFMSTKLHKYSKSWQQNIISPLKYPQMLSYPGVSFFIIALSYFLKGHELLACDFTVQCFCDTVL